MVQAKQLTASALRTIANAKAATAWTASDAASDAKEKWDTARNESDRTEWDAEAAKAIATRAQVEANTAHAAYDAARAQVDAAKAAQRDTTKLSKTFAAKEQAYKTATNTARDAKRAADVANAKAA